MSSWVKEFFKNTKNEIELSTNSFETVAKVLEENSWEHKDEFWAPDLQIDLFLNGKSKLYLLQETYFDIKISGTEEVIQIILKKLKEKGITGDFK